VNKNNPLHQELTGHDPIVEWILPGFIPRGVLLCLAGVPGAGKSYLCYYIGMAIATGTPVLGMTPGRPFQVLYFDDENSQSDRVQYERYAWNGLGRPSLDTLTDNFWSIPFALGNADWAERMADHVEEHKPDVYIVDTATPACNIQDENDNAEASRIVRQLRELTQITNPVSTGLILKHAKILTEEGDYTIRGAKAWMGQVDGFSYLIRHQSRPSKDGLAATRLVPGKTRAFGLRNTINIHPRRQGAGIVLTGNGE